jgi:peptidoglycan hydrolase CwlO-like protein
MNWLSYLGIGFSVLTAIINVTVLIAMKFNDLKHVQADLDEIKANQSKTDEKLDKLGERISKIEGKCAVNHK